VPPLAPVLVAQAADSAAHIAASPDPKQQFPAPHLSPAQQLCLGPPQARQMPDVHSRSAWLQLWLPGQQASPALPHDRQTPSWVHVVATAEQFRPAQQAWFCRPQPLQAPAVQTPPLFPPAVVQV
jgi:hypothetical protein